MAAGTLPDMVTANRVRRAFVLVACAVLLISACSSKEDERTSSAPVTGASSTGAAENAATSNPGD